MKIKWQE